MKQISFFVSGVVQGVFYRHYSAKKAKALGLRGFVKNTSEGRVEVVVEGEENKVNEFISFCKNNPGYSKVENIEIKEEREWKTPCFSDFEIRY